MKRIQVDFNTAKGDEYAVWVAPFGAYDLREGESVLLYDPYEFEVEAEILPLYELDDGSAWWVAAVIWDTVVYYED